MIEDDDLDDSASSHGESFDGGDKKAAADGVEIFSVSDDLGLGVYVSCAADTAPTDLVAGLCKLISQITEASLLHPEIKRAGDLPLGGNDNDAF